MNVTFVIPPPVDPKQQPAERSAGCTRVVYPFPNLYELYAAAMLKHDGHAVALADFINPLRTVEDFSKWSAGDASDLYCIWGVNLSVDDDVNAIKIIRAMHPDTCIVILGPSGTYFPERLLVDRKTIIVRGEPEQTLSELAARIAAGKPYADILGISFLDSDGNVHRNASRPLLKDIDTLPFPARELLDGKEFHNPKLKRSPYTTMLTSRNCPYRCIYCVPSSMTFARELDYRHDHGVKPPVSFRSIGNIAAELELLHGQGIKAIGFVDDNFIWNEERTRDIALLLSRYDMVWGCQARVDAITEPIARILGESGCRYVDLGIESFDDAILEYVKKGITSAQIYESIRLLKKYKVPVKLNILIGTSPLETKESIRKTLREARRLRVDQVMINIVSPFPGTVFYKQAIENGWIEGGEYRPTNVQRESILNYPHLTSRDMERLLYRGNLRFFLSPRFVFKQMRRFRSWKEFSAAFKALRTKLFWK